MRHVLRTSTRAHVAALATTVLAVTALSVLDAPPAAAADTSLAGVLAADGNRFDDDRRDFDVFDRALHRVLAAKPQSPVAVLTDSTWRVTAFLPTDRAFVLLVEDLTDERPDSEKAAFRTLVSTLGVDTLETLLLYHVVPYATLRLAVIAREDGVMLTMASGSNVGIDVTETAIKLVDNDTNDPNARLVPDLANINVGHRQVAHGISRVLRPGDL